MDIRKYLKTQGISALEFSRRSGVPHSSIYRLISTPWRVPRSDIAQAVIRASGGAITLDDLVHYSRRKRLPKVAPDPPQADPDQVHQGGNAP